MTIQTVVQSVALRVVGTTPNAVFSSTEQVVRELIDLAQDVAIDIARAAEWRKLIAVATIGSGDTFPVPVDYDRMLTGQGPQDVSGGPYEPFATVSDYIAAQSGWASPGWIIIGDDFRFHPALTGPVTFPYMSCFIVRDADGVRKRTFTADSDEFVLDERLLTLGLLWRYRAQEGLDYSEDMANFELALSKATLHDKGARVLNPDRTGIPGAYYINRPCR